MNRRALLWGVAVALGAYGMHALYLDARYAGVTDCAEFVSAPATRSFVQLRGCRIGDAWLTAIPRSLDVAPGEYAYVTGASGFPDSVRLFVRLRDLRATGSNVDLAGRVVDGSNDLRMAIASSNLPLGFHWRVLEPQTPPSGPAGGFALLVGVALGVGLLRRGTTQGAVNAAPAPGPTPHPARRPVPRTTSGEGEQPASPEAHTAQVVDVTPIASARRQLRFALWALYQFIGCVVVFMLALPGEQFPAGDTGRALVLLALTIGGIVGVRRGIVRIPGAAAHRAERFAGWGAAGLGSATLLAWSRWHNEVITAAGVFLFAELIAIGVAAHSITTLNGFAEPKLGLREGALLRTYGHRPGMFASGRYVAVVIWGVVAGLGWLAGIVAALVIAAVNYVSPINLINLLYPRLVKPLLFQASRAGQRRRRYSSPSAQAVMRSDRRAPILVLRSFVDDDLQGREDRSWFRSADTFEEVLADRLWSFGPVIAIGQPGEPIPRAGAARDYVSHDAWQQRVHALAADAAMIVIIAGRTAGIVWELEHASRAGVLAKVVLVIPPVETVEAEARLSLLRRTVGDAELAAMLGVSVPQNTLALLLGGMPPVALTAPERTARFYEEAIGLAARTVIGPRPRSRSEEQRTGLSRPQSPGATSPSAAAPHAGLKSLSRLS